MTPLPPATFRNVIASFDWDNTKWDVVVNSNTQRGRFIIHEKGASQGVKPIDAITNGFCDQQLFQLKDVLKHEMNTMLQSLGLVGVVNKKRVNQLINERTDILHDILIQINITAYERGRKSNFTISEI